MKPPTLKKTQSQLKSLIAHPIKRGSFSFIKDSGLSPARRIGIYSIAYHFRILEVLKKDFPALHKILGESRFRALVKAYLTAHPPSHYSLRYAGQDLPRFLKKHAFSRKRPYLNELARMEWAMVDAFDAPDESLLTMSALRSIPPDQWASLKLALPSSSRLLKFSWPVDHIHRKATGKLLKGTVRRKGAHTTWIRLWRKQLKVYYRRIDPIEALALQMIQQRKNFGQIGTRLARHIPQEKTTHSLAQFLIQWIRDESVFVR